MILDAVFDHTALALKLNFVLFALKIKEQKKQEKILKEMAKKLDMETKKAERDGAKVKQLESEMSAVVKDRGM